MIAAVNKKGIAEIKGNKTRLLSDYIYESLKNY